MPVTVSMCMSIAGSVCPSSCPVWVRMGGNGNHGSASGNLLHVCEETCVLPCLTVGPTSRTGIRSCAMGWSMHPTPNCRWGCAPSPSLQPRPAPLSLGESYCRVLSWFCLSILKCHLPCGFPREEVGAVHIEWMWLLYIWPQAVCVGGLGNGNLAVGRSTNCWSQPLGELPVRTFQFMWLFIQRVEIELFLCPVRLLQGMVCPSSWLHTPSFLVLESAYISRPGERCMDAEGLTQWLCHFSLKGVNT